MAPLSSAEQAIDAARRDTDQYAIEMVVTYRGDPLQRTSTSFMVHFVDGDKVWLPWSMDISSTQAFEVFCQARSELSCYIPLKRLSASMLLSTSSLYRKLNQVMWPMLISIGMDTTGMLVLDYLTMTPRFT